MGDPQREPTIDEDNQSAIKLATSKVRHKISKHTDTKNHFIRNKVEAKTIQLKNMPTHEMGADILKKSLPQLKVERHSRKSNWTIPDYTLRNQA